MSDRENEGRSMITNTSQEVGDHADGVRIEPADDGNITFRFMNGQREVLSGVFTPQQVSVVVAGLLNAATGSFRVLGKDAALTPPTTIEQPINVTKFNIALTKVRGRYAIVAQAGEATVGFAIDRGELRRVARLLNKASYHPESGIRTAPLLRDLLTDFFDDLGGWSGVLKARIKAVCRRRATRFWVKVSGRSYRSFRTIDVSSDLAPPEYRPVGRCIYCGSSVYSNKAGIRPSPLGAEHVIPEGLDGKLELPEASCHACEAATSRLERDVLLRTIKALRLYLRIRGKRRSSRPATLPLSVSENGVDRVIHMPVEDYPVFLNMPMYGTPGIFTGGQGGNQTTSGFTVVMLRYDAPMLKMKYGITTFSSPVWDTHALFRMLGKIGHSLAAAEIGLDLFKPQLIEMILTQATEAFNCIGGCPELEAPTRALHELGLGYQRANGKDYVVARIRLFAKNNGPTYYVVVGESREARIAKFRRVLNWKLSQRKRA
ncbi:hypothetical protein ACF1BQ_026550 [Bradyrhizobium sp. RDT10]